MIDSLTLPGLPEREPSHGFDLKRVYYACFSRSLSAPAGEVDATFGRLARAHLQRPRELIGLKQPGRLVGIAAYADNAFTVRDGQAGSLSAERVAL
jgi:hypothetical protein